MQEENEALQKLVLELAGNNSEARSRASGLRERYTDLLHEVRPIMHDHLLNCSPATDRVDCQLSPA